MNVGCTCSRWLTVSNFLLAAKIFLLGVLSLFGVVSVGLGVGKGCGVGTGGECGGLCAGSLVFSLTCPNGLWEGLDVGSVFFMGFGTALLGARVGNGGLVCRASRAFSVGVVVLGWVWAGIGVGTEWVSCLCTNRLGFVLGFGNLVFSGSGVGIGMGCNARVGKVFMLADFSLGLVVDFIFFLRLEGVIP